MPDQLTPRFPYWGVGMGLFLSTNVRYMYSAFVATILGLLTSYQFALSFFCSNWCLLNFSCYSIFDCTRHHLISSRLAYDRFGGSSKKYFYHHQNSTKNFRGKIIVSKSELDAIV